MTDDEIKKYVKEQIPMGEIGCLGMLVGYASFLYCIYLGFSLNAWPFNKFHPAKPPVTRPAIWYEPVK